MARHQGPSYENEPRLFRIIQKTNFVVGLLVGLSVIGTTLLLFASAILRYVFREPLGQSSELSGWLFLLMTTLGMAYTLQVNGHVNFSLVEDKLGSRGRAWLQLISAIICLVVFVLFTIGGWGMFWRSLVLGWRTTDMRIPTALVQWMVPVGFGLLSLEGLVLLVHRAFTLKIAMSATKKAP